MDKPSDLCISCYKRTDCYFPQLGFMCWNCKADLIKNYNLTALKTSLIDVNNDSDWVRQVDKGNKVAGSPPTS